MTDVRLAQATSSATPPVARLLLVLAWHIRAGAPIPLCINHLGWPHQDVSVQVANTGGAKDWARRFGLGVSVSRSQGQEFVCIRTEPARIDGCAVKFWGVGVSSDYPPIDRGEVL